MAIAYKNFAANANISHIGLGVAANNATKSLRRGGVPTQAWPVADATHLRSLLASKATD